MLASLFVTLVLSGDAVAWEKDYEAAFTKAKDRNVPVLLCFNMDKEPASEGMISLYRDSEFVTRSKDFVCLIGSTYLHNPEESADPCPKFAGITCAEHHKVEIKGSAEFVGTDTVISPQHVLISPERKVLLRRAYTIGKGELLKLMRMAEKAVQSGKYAGAEGEAKRIDELLKLAKDRNAEKRKPAIAELGRTENIDAIAALISLLDPKQMDDTRIDALSSLATKGNYDALPHVAARLSDSNTTVVKHAIVALERIGLPAAVAPLLKLWKKKPLGFVACEIPRALAACDPANPEVPALIKKACAGKDSTVELSALVALRYLPPDADTRKLLADKLVDSNGNVRGVAVWVIGMTRDRPLLPQLTERQEKENNAEVREILELALKNFQAEDGAKPVAGLDEKLKQFVAEDVPRS